MRIVLARPWIVVAALLGIMACDSNPLGDVPGVDLRTQAEYMLSAVDSRYEVVVSYAIGNHGPEAVFVPANCLDDYRLGAERLVEGVWKSATISYDGRVIADCLRDPPTLVIAPGDELEGRLDLLSREGIRSEALYGAHRLILPELLDGSGQALGPIRSGVFVVVQDEAGG